MKNKITATLLLLSAVLFNTALFGSATLEQAGCELTASTVLAAPGNCPNSPVPDPNNPYKFFLQKKVSGSFVQVASSGSVGQPAHNFTPSGPGIYRAVAQVWRATGPPSNWQLYSCNNIQQFTYTSSEMEYNGKEWLTYPLGYGDDSDKYIAVRTENNEARVYWMSYGRMYEYRWGGSSWIKSELIAPSKGSWHEDCIGTMACEVGNSTNIYYANDNIRFSRNSRSLTTGAWTNIELPGVYPQPTPGGQIAAGPEGIIYTGGPGPRIFLLRNIGGFTFDEVNIDVGGPDASPYLVRLSDGGVVYRTDDGNLVYLRLNGNGTYSPANQTTISNVAPENLATDGNDVFYIAYDKSIWRWNRSGLNFPATTVSLGGVKNVGGDVSAAPARPGEVFYRGLDNRMWYFKNGPSGWVQRTATSATNVKGPLAVKSKIVYRATNNDIWHQYEKNCPGKMSAPAFDLEEVDAFMLEASPNPAQDHLTIRVTTDQAANGTIDLYDLYGKKVRRMTAQHEFTAGVHEMEVNVADLAAGTYLLKWTGSNDQRVRKIIIQ